MSIKLATLFPEPPVAKTLPGLLSIQTSTDEALVDDQVTVDEQVVWPMIMLQGFGEALIDPDGAGVGVGVLVKVGVGVLVLVGVGVLVFVGVGVLVLVGVGVFVFVGVGVLVLVGVGVLVLVGVGGSVGVLDTGVGDDCAQQFVSSIPMYLEQLPSISARVSSHH